MVIYTMLKKENHYLVVSDWFTHILRVKKAKRLQIKVVLIKEIFLISGNNYVEEDGGINAACFQGKSGPFFLTKHP